MAVHPPAATFKGEHDGVGNLDKRTIRNSELAETITSIVTTLTSVLFRLSTSRAALAFTVSSLNPTLSSLPYFNERVERPVKSFNLALDTSPDAIKDRLSKNLVCSISFAPYCRISSTRFFMVDTIFLIEPLSSQMPAYFFVNLRSTSSTTCFFERELCEKLKLFITSRICRSRLHAYLDSVLPYNSQLHALAPVTICHDSTLI